MTRLAQRGRPGPVAPGCAYPARACREKRHHIGANFRLTGANEVAKMESLTADAPGLGIKVQHTSGSTAYAAYQRGAFDE